MPARPWHPLVIADCGEPLQPLPPELLRLEPHPYASVGAPYGPGQSPFQLRSSVVRRLRAAQAALQCRQSGCRLAIFDGWRPLAVQAFMVQRTVREQCCAAGVDPEQRSLQLHQIQAEVGRFWASPSHDPATPPPHSTGGAVDLTLADAGGAPLAMGGEIDAIGAISEPDHHAAAAAADPTSPAALWHQRRRLLAEVMVQAGFAQHPNEWWHFSYGDQLWAWRQQQPRAIYGRIEPAASSSLTC